MKLLSRAALGLAISASVAEAQLSIMIGDNDGYGFGVADDGIGVVWPGPGSSGSDYDGRSLAEMAAVNGAAITDVYSALHPCCGPNAFSVGSVSFPVLGDIVSGSLTVDMADFEASVFGPFLVSFNGVVQPWLFNFDDGFRNTVVRSFVLDAATIASINAANAFTVTIDRNGSDDFVAFDYFQLDARLSAVPEPSTWGLTGIGLAVGALALRRRRAV